MGWDPRRRANAAVVELSVAFLDRGAARWTHAERHKGFLHFFASLEHAGSVPWRAHAREVAIQLMNEGMVGDALDSNKQDAPVCEEVAKPGLADGLARGFSRLSDVFTPPRNAPNNSMAVSAASWQIRRAGRTVQEVSNDNRTDAMGRLIYEHLHAMGVNEDPVRGLRSILWDLPGWSDFFLYHHIIFSALPFDFRPQRFL